MNFNKVSFLISAASQKDFPQKRLPEIAFAGKSNVGKSSVINRILNRKNFARVGDKPGKTIHVNYFTVDEKCYFVDLPGYGYAKVSQSEKERWGKLMESYFAAERITLGVLSIGIAKGMTITIVADGDDEDAAIKGLVELIESGFND